jgi:hypothetical protein
MIRSRRSIIGLLMRVVALFVALNVLFALLNPVPALGNVSLYSIAFPGRQRLPYGDEPARAYNLSLFDLNAMFASHAVSKAKPADEFRVLMIGDSSTWGWFLENKDTLAGLLNAKDMRAGDGRRVRVYNLGYPIMSLMKDALLLDRAMQLQPDLIVWPVTLESFPSSKQLTHPIVQNNAQAIRNLIAKYDLRADPNDPAFVEPSLLDRTIVGQRRALADWFRLQAFGVMWGATGIDQFIPEKVEPAQRDLEVDEGFHEMQPPALNKAALAFDVLDAGLAMAGEVPVLVVNEPILISKGANSDVRYNFFYPRWAYDQYRGMLAEHMGERSGAYLDLWDVVPDSEFTNSAVHVTPAGSSLVADRLAAEIQRMIQ